MSGLMDTILADIKSAMKAGEKDKLTCLRGIHSEVKNVSINEKKEITDEVVLTSLTKGVKQRKDSIESFKNGGREDLVEQTAQEITWIEEYLPTPLSPEELEAIVASTIQELGASSKKDMGHVMKALKPKVAGRADGKALSQLVGAKLG
jgi:uncharacterized protein YqeY